MKHPEYQYLELAKNILENGHVKTDRTGTGTKSLFGGQFRFDLSKGFPMLTTKKLHLKSIIHELIWFLSGQTNIKYLTDNGVKIWDAWATQEGDLGPVYGAQWRHWRTTEGKEIDQIANIIDQIKNNPDSRRIIVTAWNPEVMPINGLTAQENARLGKQALPACHCMFQFYVADGKLSCQLYQRSADLFLGVPFNIASYSLLTMMVAQVCGLEVGDYVHTFGDVHIYNDHFEQMKEQISRTPYEFPTMSINKDVNNIFDFKFEDFDLKDTYQSHPHIKGKVSV